MGHGDCDNDLECVGSLKCGSNNCVKYNVSVADPFSDCCEVGSICFFLLSIDIDYLHGLFM